jgi:PBP1b-binding outer membrane lipoprotein LpoB
MKNNKKIALIFICTIILTGCFNKDEKVSIDTDKSTANNIEVPVNKVYEDIADKKE